MSFFKTLFGSLLLLLTLCSCSSITTLFGLLGSDDEDELINENKEVAQKEFEVNPYEQFVETRQKEAEKKRELSQLKTLEAQQELEKQKALAEKKLPFRNKKILVLPFFNKTSLKHDKLNAHVVAKTEELIENLDNFSPFNRSQLAVDLKTLQSSQDNYDLNAVFELARSRDIDAVAIGSIESIAFEEEDNEVGLFRSKYHVAQVKIFMQVFDVTTEQALLSKMEEAQVRDEFANFLGDKTLASQNVERAKTALNSALRESLKSLSKLANRISWTGEVIKVRAPRFYINGGEKSGLKLGQLLKVMESGDPIYNENKTKEIGYLPGRIKGILRIVDFVGEDGLIAVAHSGNYFQQGDRVELYLPRKRSLSSDNL